MPIIKVKDSDEFEDKPAKEGTHPIRIVKAERRDSEAGNPMIDLTLKVEGPGGADAALFKHWLMIPHEGDANYRMRMRDFQRFGLLFGIESFDPDSADDVGNLEGLTAECYLSLEPMKDKQGRETGQEVNRLRLPKAGRK